MFKVVIAGEITKDDQPFADIRIQYYNMEYADVVLVEDKMIGMLSALNDEAKVKTA